jgi:protein arginine N-methyltransferase 1
MTHGALDFLETCQWLLDRERIDAHAGALEAAVTPGATVVDVGSSLGAFAVLACRCGARRVYAIDPSPMIELAREVAVANGFGDRIEFIRADSRRVTLPERTDVAIVEARNVLPELQLPLTIDARDRLLRPGGSLIPAADELCGAIVSSRRRYDAVVGVWKWFHGMKAGPAYLRSSHTWIRQQIGSNELLGGEASSWATIDYRTARDSHISGRLDVDVTARGEGHGLCMWFESTLAGRVRFTNRPGRLRHGSGSAYFPWPEPVLLSPGDHVRVSIDAEWRGDGYRWRWQTTVTRASGTVSATFEQDTAPSAPESTIAHGECDAGSHLAATCTR